MDDKNRMKNQVFLILITAILTSCSVTASPAETPLAGIPETVEEMADSSSIGTVDNTEQAIIVPTGTEEIDLGEPTLTPSPEEKAELAVELFNNYDECDLPCWWGIVPGETTWQEAYNILGPIALGIREPSEEFPYAEAVILVTEEIDEFVFFTQAYPVENGIVTRIEVETRNVFRYSLSNILGKYGKPDEVRIKIRYLREGQNILAYYLFYPSKGILAIYNTPAIIGEKNVVMCPHNEPASVLLLWSPSETKTASDVLGSSDFIGGQSSGYTPDKIPLLEELTNTNSELFYNAYLDPNAEVCFSTPKDAWPIP